MPGFLDLIDPSINAPKGPAPAPGLADLAGEGLRSTALNARAGLHDIAGTALDAVGLSGSEQKAKGSVDRAHAQVEGKDLVPFKDADLGMQGLRYGAGMLGSAAPMLAAGAAGGILGGSTGAMLAGTAALAPSEIGDQMQRQNADPANNFATPADRLSTAVPIGLGRSALQNIVPGGVASRLVAGGAEKTLAGIGLRAAADIPANAAASAGSEALSQYGDNMLNPNAGYDQTKVEEAGKEGGAAGAVFGGLGALGHLAHNLPGRAIGAAKDLVPAKPSETGGDGSTPAETSGDPVSRLAAIVKSAKDGAGSMMDKMADGKETSDPTAPDPEAAQAVADQTSFQKATQWASELAKEHLSPENAAKLSDAASDLGDKANQTTVAIIKRGQDAISSVTDAASAFKDAVNARVEAKADTGVKKSEDFSGTQKAVSDAIVGVLGEDHPIFQSPKALNDLAAGLRPYMEQVASGKAFDSFDKLDHLTKLFDVTGDKTGAVLKAVHDAVGDPNADKESFFNTLNQIDEVQKGRMGVLDAMAKNIKPELADSVRPGDMRKVADALGEWAQKKTVSLHGPEEASAHDAAVKAQLEHFFGDKSDVVMAAVEKNVKKETNILDLAHTTEIESKDGQSTVKYYAKNKELYQSPEIDKGSNGHEGAATQAMKRAERDNPGSTVAFKKASEIGLDDKMVKAKHADLMAEAKKHGLDEEQAKAHADKHIDEYGAVTAESAKSETALNSGEVDSMRLDTHQFGKSPSRIDAGAGHIIDAMKLVKVMAEKMKGSFTNADDSSRSARTANLFKEGVAALQAHLGRTFTIPDSTKITPGEKGLTWGDVKKLDARTAADKASDAKTKEINDLRKQYKTAKTIAERQAIAKEGKRLVGEKEWDVIKEQGADHSNIAVDESGREPEKQDNVHAALKGGENPKAEIRTNLDGSNRADTVMGRRAPAKSTGEPPSPKERAAKQAAFVEAVRSGDKATIHELATSDNTKGLQRAVEHLNTLKDANDPKVAHAIDTANARIAELIQKPGEAYGMQTKKYSMQSDLVHASLERSGFPATHDSPIKHEGEFNWRKHLMKGEGAAVKGAGTYLSTSDSVHKFYKAQFTETVRKADGVHDRLEKAVTNAKDDLDAPDLTDAKRAELREALTKARAELSAHKPAPEQADAVSPTYHVSVDIPHDKLMDWSKPIADQPHMKAVFDKAVKEFGLTDYDKGREPPLPDTVRGEDFYKELSVALDKKDEFNGDRAASEYLQANGIDGHRMDAAGKGGKENPNYVIYNDDKISTNYVHFSQERADPNASGPQDRATVEAYVKQVAPHIAVEWANIPHAGEFDSTKAGDIMRLSVHALNPLATAYHEAMHGLFSMLKKSGDGHISDVLEKAGSSEHVLNQLKELLKDHPEALKQLSDPEERAAYMYQFHEQGKLTLGPAAKNIFQSIAKFIRSVTGMLTNDERAEKIMAYFHSGEFEKNRSDMNAVSEALMKNKGSEVFEKVKAMTEPFRNMADTLASAGGARLRDTGIPALRQLADAMKLKTTTEGRDAGFVPAARSERSRIMNQIGTDLKPYSKEAIAEALEAMQTGVKAQSMAARTVAAMVGKRLAEQLKYMQDAGVNITALGMKDGVPYFPRSWDASYISGHQREFMAMLNKYKATGQLKGDPKQLMNKLMVTDGAEFNVEVDKPGMQAAKERSLAFISHADAATFMRKDMHQILNSYVTQATRRAEWSRRFGDNGKGITALIDNAKKQGATPAQLDAAAKFVRSVDGTLGDGINPTARRMMGNMIVYQNLRLLPLAIFSSAVDAQGIMVRGGTVGEAFKTFKRGATEMVKNFQKDPQSDKMTQLAETLGVVDSAMLVHTLGASYSQGMVGNKGRAINDTFFRLNLMEQYNTSMRVGATEAAMNFIARHATDPGKHSVRFLRELGLSAEDVQLDHDGRPKTLTSDGLSEEHSAKMKAAVNRWVDGAILRPDAVDKPIWMSDPHYALMAHLKQFVFSFHETILKRVAHEAANGNYSPAMALAGYVPMMIAADMVKGMIQGGGSTPSWKENWGPQDYVWSGMERAGLFGVGQFGIDAMGDIREGGSGIGALTGPTAEQLTEGLKVLGGREQFHNFAVKGLPANALYASSLHATASDPKFAD